MAYLAGLAFPVNSVGELPLAYVDASGKQQAEAMLVNARSILEMYKVKEREKMAKELRYKAFSGFNDESHSIPKRVAEIRGVIDEGNWTSAIQKSDDLMKLGLQGLRYLQTYDWLFLRTLVTAGYLGWIAFSLTLALDQHVLNGQIEVQRSSVSQITFSSILVSLYALLYAQSSPWTYYAYAIFPVIFWEEVFTRREALVKGIKALSAQLSSKDIAGFAFNIATFFGALEIMVGR